MGLAGELTTIGLAEVFQNLSFNHLTGTLTLQEVDRKARICFEEGKVRAIDTKFDYVDIARRMELAPDEELAKAENGKRRRTLKAFLAATGHLDEAAFDSIITSCVQEELLPLFGWRAASFSFEEGPIKSRVFGKEQLDCNIALDPMAVAMEAARRHDEWDTLENYVPTDKEVLLLLGKPEEELSPKVWKTLEMLDGTRPVVEVVKKSPLGRYDVLKTIATYVEAGWLVTATPEALREMASQATTSSRINLAVQQLESALQIDATDLETYRVLTKLYERAGRKNEAAETQLRMADLQVKRGDVEGALESFERARVLAPQNLDILERIFRLHESRGEQPLAMRAGRRLAEALIGQELFEDAIPLYERLLASNERNVGLREALGRCLEKQGDPGRAATEFRLLADRAMDRREFEGALTYYRKVVTLDPDCEHSRERIDEIKSGAAKSREKRRKRWRATAVWSVVTGLLLWIGVREWSAINGLHAAHHATVTNHDTSFRARLDTMQRYADAVVNYPATRSSSLAQDTLRALLLLEVDRADTLLHQAAKAKTISDVEATLGLAEKILAGLKNLSLPEAEQELWEGAQKKLLAQVKTLRTPAAGVTKNK